MTKNSAGIGGRIESVSCLGGFVSMTGGSEMQRRFARDYSKMSHAAHAKEMKAKADMDANVSGTLVEIPL